MTAKKKITERGILKSDIKRLMTPKAINDLQDLSPTMQQFLLRWQEQRDIILGQQLRDELTKSVTESVSRELAETLVPIFSLLAEIRSDLAEIKTQLTNLKTDMAHLEARVKHLEKRTSTWMLMIKIGIGLAFAWILHEIFMKG